MNPATPPVSETVEAAWKALIAESLRRNPVVAVGEHRGRVEAAIRAEADERVAALREADVARMERALHDGGIGCGYGEHSHRLDAEEVIAQLDAAPEDAR